MTVAAAGGGFEAPCEDVLARAAAAFGLLASLAPTDWSPGIR
ncbi:hypothetical protein ACGF8D_12060 [Streptomyces massasporeus]